MFEHFLSIEVKCNFSFGNLRARKAGCANGRIVLSDWGITRGQVGKYTHSLGQPMTKVIARPNSPTYSSHLGKPNRVND